MDSMNAQHSLDMVNGQKHDKFKYSYGLEPYPKNPEACELRKPNGRSNEVCTNVMENGCGIEPIKIRLDMPSITAASTAMPHTNNEAQIALPRYQNGNCAGNTDEVYAPPASIHTLISDTFDHYLSETSNSTTINAGNQIANVDMLSAAATVAPTEKVIVAPIKARTTPKVTKLKSLKRPTINYSHQKLILSHKEHIPLQSLLSPDEPHTNGNEIEHTAKKKMTKPDVAAVKSRKMVKKKVVTIARAASTSTENDTYPSCLTNGVNGNATTSVALPQHPSGVYFIPPNAAATTTMPGSQLIENKVPAGNDDKFTMAAQPKKQNGVGVNDEHIVAMNFNFVEYVQADSHAVQTKNDHNITLKTDGDNIIYEDLTTYTKLVYNIISPEWLSLSKKEPPPVILAPVKTVQQAVEHVSDETITKIKRRGRPRRSSSSSKIKPDDAKRKDDERKILPCSRTRYGRLSRPPRGMKIFADNNKGTENQATEPPETNGQDIGLVTVPLPSEPPPPIDDVPANVEEFSSDKIDVPPPEMKRQRNIDRFKCLTCKKVYLGENKMFKHLKAFPDHKLNIQRKTKAKRAEAPPAVLPLPSPSPESYPSCEQLQCNDLPPSDNPTIFDELMRRVRETPKEKRVHLFFTEVSDFLERFEMLAPKLTSTTDADAATEYLDKHVCKLLGIQEGNYQINESIFDRDLPQRLCDTSFSDLNDDHPEPMSQPLEYNLNILSFDGISNCKLNEGISSECLLTELVKERSKNLPDATGTPVDTVSYDHISDNAVEAVTMNVNNHNGIHTIGTSPILDLAMDLFQFNSN